MNFGLDKALDILTREIQSWLVIIVKSLPNFALAVVILGITFLAATFIKRITHSVFSKSTKNQAALQLVEKIIYVTIFATGFFIVLGVLQLDKTVTSLLAGAGVLGLALGFAFQEIASNFVSGILIAFQEPYRIGDIVEVGPYTGQVKEIELRSTVITTFNGLDVIVPNKNMYTQPLTNYTTTPLRRLELKVGISYSDDLRKVESVAKRAVETIPGRVLSEPVELFFTEFADSSINFVLHVWIDYPAQNNFNRFRHAAIIAVKEAFDNEGISIPFPIRTLEFNETRLNASLSRAPK